MNDSEFDDLLRAAKEDLPLPSSFKLGVWHRIESVGAELATGFAPPHYRWRMALGVAATVALGMWLGAASIPETKEPQLAYAESISPFHHNRAK